MTAVLGERALRVWQSGRAAGAAGIARIGYAFSQWIANRHGFQWLVDQVWP